MKFGSFFLAEYLNMITASGVITTLYLGGWQMPYIDQFHLSALTVSVLQMGAFALKVGIMLLFFIVVRWTLPRFRYDQLMSLGWKVMLPAALLNIAVTGLLMLL
jgi:NADH-quinone oxidoreductase subunit H